MLFSFSEIVELAVPVHECPERHTRIYSLDSSNPLKITLLVKQVQYRDLETCKQAMSRALRNQILRHANIAATYDLERSPGIVLEEVEAGKSYLYYLYSDLKESFRSLAIRKKQEGSRVPEEDLVSYYQSLIPALAHLQHHGVALRNISPDSVYFSTEGVIKLMDFDFSEVLNFQDARPEILAYLSPKLREAAARGPIEVSRFQHDPFKSDVFSLGMTLVHLSLLGLPETSEAMSRKHLNGMLQTLKCFYSEEWCSLLTKLLEYEEGERPDFYKLESELPLTKIVSTMAPIQRAGSQNTCVYVINDNINRWNQPVVIKQIKCSNLGDFKCAENELRFAQSRFHPNICESIDFVVESSQECWRCAYIVFPKMKGSLRDDIDLRCTMLPESKHYTEQELWSYLTQLVDVFASLQGQHIVHRDIKPDSILISPDGTLKVCDFEFARKIQIEGPALITLLGSHPYMSPILRERLISNSRYLVHDAFKSDVYSLGMVMLHLTALELPDSLTVSKNLKENLKNCVATCKKDLNEEEIGYSEEWFSILGIMLTHGEEARPNFFDLKRKLTDPLSYFDDEYIDPIILHDAHFSSPLKMKAEFGLTYARVSETASETVPCLITLEAHPVETSQRINSIDVICLVDESGSMEYEKLDIAKKALHFMIDNLTERDRMCIIGFSDYADRRCPLLACSENGKSTLRDIVNRLVNHDLTNFVEALQMAMKVITQRSRKNPSVQIVVLSDGRDSSGEDVSEACLEVLNAHPIEGLTVHCLGIGEEADVRLLEALAKKGNGECHFIECSDSLPSSFAAAFHDFSRVVARDVSISVSLHPASKVHCKVAKLFSKNETREFRIPEISANTRTELLFLIETELQPFSTTIGCPPVKLELKYKDHEGISCQEVIAKDLKFFRWAVSSPQQKASVFQHWIRARATENLFRARDTLRPRELITQNKIDEAREEIFHGLKQIESDQVYGNMQMVQSVKQDLKKVLDFLGEFTQGNRGGNIQLCSIFYRLESLRYTVPIE